MTLDQIPLWLFTSFVGAAFVKGLDLFARRINRSRDERHEIADQILNHVSLFGELTQLYRFLANVSSEVIEDEDGEIMLDDEGRPIVETKLFEIEPELEGALSELKGVDLRGAIAQQIARISLSSSEAIDLSLQLDSSGKIREQLNVLWMDTVFALQNALKRKEVGKPFDRFNDLIDSLKKADESRREAREMVLRHR